MGYILLVLAGALICNSLPHLFHGLDGTSFPTPFAKPPGVGNSPAVLNFFWGALNLFVGIYLLYIQFALIVVGCGLIALGAGFLALGIMLTIHFEKVRKKP